MNKKSSNLGKKSLVRSTQTPNTLGNYPKKYIFALGISGFMTSLGVAAFVSFSFGYSDGFKQGFKDRFKEETTSPLSSKINIHDKLDIPIDKFIEGITILDGEKPSQSFKEAVNSVYSGVLLKVADRYKLSESEKKKMLNEYSYISNELTKKHFNELKGLSKKRQSFSSSELVRLERHAVANDFNVLLTDNICSISSIILAYVTFNREVKILFNKSCGFLLQGIVNPWAEEMKARGLVIDVTQSKYEIEKHTRQVIAELATSEEQINETLKNTYPRIFFENTWIEFSSNASLTIEAKSIIKAGFKLHESSTIRIVPSTQIIYVTLPRAIILSNSIEYKIIEDKNGLFNNITTEKRNAVIAELRSSLEQLAIQNGILNEAESHATKVIKYFYSPITNLPGSPFEVIVEIQK